MPTASNLRLGMMLAWLLCSGLATAQLQDPCLTRSIHVFVGNQKKALDRLGPDNFSAEVNKQSIKVVSVEPNIAPRRFLILLDISESMRTARSVDRVLYAAQEAITALPPESSCSVTMFDEQIEAKMSCSSNPSSLKVLLSSFKPKRKTAIFDTLKTSVDSLKDPSSDDVILLITDGIDNASKHKVGEMRRIILKTGVRLFALTFYNRDPDELRYGVADMDDLGSLNGNNFVAGDRDFPNDLPGFSDFMYTQMLYMTRAYRLTIKLSAPLQNDQYWKLKLKGLPPDLKKSASDLLYPQKLSGCQ